jgi:hypothetical protein
MFNWLKKLFNHQEIQIDRPVIKQLPSGGEYVPQVIGEGEELMVLPADLVANQGRRIDNIIIHCSATRPSQDIGVKTLRKWHTDPKPNGRGWRDVGYNYVIRRSGKTELGRDVDGDGFVEDEVGAHTFGWNAHSIGICLIGGVAMDGQTPEPNFTDAQMAALGAMLVSMKQRYPDARIMGHRDTGANKACPSFDVAKWLKEYGLDT